MAWLASLLLGSLLPHGVSSAILATGAFTPTVGKATVVGNVADPAINRDSCGSTRIGNRAFWTCRDSQPYDSNGVPILPIWASSASWSNFNADGSPGLQQYGGGGSRNPYFPYTADECNGNSAGACADGSRYAIWPDSPPLVTSSINNIVTAYTWIRKAHIKPEVRIRTADVCLLPVVLHTYHIVVSRGCCTSVGPRSTAYDSRMPELCGRGQHGNVYVTLASARMTQTQRRRFTS